MSLLVHDYLQYLILTYALLKSQSDQELQQLRSDNDFFFRYGNSSGVYQRQETWA